MHDQWSGCRYCYSTALFLATHTQGRQDQLGKDSQSRRYWGLAIHLLADSIDIRVTRSWRIAPLEQWCHHRNTCDWACSAHRLRVVRDMGHISDEERAHLSDTLSSQPRHGPCPIVSLKSVCRTPRILILARSMFLLGMPFYVIFVQLPQRFQVVNFTSAERAGILLLPATLVSPVGAMAAGLAAKRVPVEFVLILATAVVCIGIGLLSSLPTYSHLWPGVYGYEVITGLGLGLASPPYFMIVATSISERDISVGTGALNMMRTLGGAVAVAICTAIHREYLNDNLSDFLSPEQVIAVQDSSTFIAKMPEGVRDQIGNTFGGSYNRQFKIMLAFTGLNFLVAILLALVRKRMGIFNAIPDRSEDNEFMKAAQKEGRDEEAKGGNKESADVDAAQSARTRHNSDDIQTVEEGTSTKVG